MNTITVDPEKCLQDGMCIQACPFGIFAPTESGVPEVVERARPGCHQLRPLYCSVPGSGHHP